MSRVSRAGDWGRRRQVRGLRAVHGATASNRQSSARDTARRTRLTSAIACAFGLLVAPAVLAAQSHEHRPGMTHPAETTAPNATPRETGQSAFAAIAELVQILVADSTTDWSQVNLEAVRQHLRDMDLVMLSSQVAASKVSAGVRLEVTGTPEVAAAIRRMLHGHAGALEAELPVSATVAHHDEGVVFTVVARDAADARLVARLQGLGFAGLLATGNHHQAHHLALARGGAMEHGAQHTHGSP